MSNPFEVLEARLINIESILINIQNNSVQNKSQIPDDELLTVKATALFLSLSVPTIYALIAKGDLPVMKRSKRCYFSKLDLINYLKLGKKNTAPVIASDATSYLKLKQK